MHMRNSAEQAILTWKNKLIVRLCGVENFPNAPMVTPPQTTPNNIEPIDARNIKS